MKKVGGIYICDAPKECRPFSPPFEEWQQWFRDNDIRYIHVNSDVFLFEADHAVMYMLRWGGTVMNADLISSEL